MRCMQRPWISGSHDLEGVVVGVCCSWGNNRCRILFLSASALPDSVATFHCRFAFSRISIADSPHPMSPKTNPSRSLHVSTISEHGSETFGGHG
ncbi:hypothetical protein ACFX1S_014892 [Malus domestica]